MQEYTYPFIRFRHLLMSKERDKFNKIYRITLSL